MEHSDASAAVWNPALRSEDGENQNHVAVAADTADSIEATPAVSLPSSSSLPTTQDTVSGAVDSSDVGIAAPGEDTDKSPFSDEDVTQAETPDGTQEKVAEVTSTAVGDSKDVVIQEVETAMPGDDGLHSSGETHMAEVEAAPVQSHKETSHGAHDAVQDLSGYGDTVFATHKDPSEHPASVHGEIGATNHDLWGSPKSVDNGEDDFFNQLKTQTKPIYVPPEVESRFEEGIPLLDDSAETPTEAPTQQPGHLNTVFTGDEDEDDGFFSSAQKPAAEGETQKLFHISRKSTSQVIDSLGASQDSPTSPVSPSAEEFNNVLAAAAAAAPKPNDTEKETSTEEDLAARWQAELSDDELAEAPAEDDLAARWQAELDDDDLLLEDEVAEDAKATNETTVPSANGDHSSQGLGSPFGTPQSVSRPQLQQTYAPHQPSTSDLLQGVPVQGVIPAATSGPYPASYFQSRPEPPAPTAKAESFAERPKEGYKSPYDLPEDLAPRRRPVQKPVVLPTPAPPRRSSIPAPPPPKSSSPVSTPLMGSTTSPKSGGQAPVPAAPKNFYEELPLPPVRPRSRPASSGRYTPSAGTAAPPVTQPPPPVQPVAASSHVAGDIAQHQLQQPERLGPYANTLDASTQSVPAVPSVASRFSPKPPTLHPGAKPAAAPRYSPAPPPSAVPLPPNRYVSQPTGFPAHGTSLPFQPRTSSPLAHHEKVSYQPQEAAPPPSQPAASEIYPIGAQQRQVDAGVTIAPPHPGESAPAGSVNVDTHGEVSNHYQPSSPHRNPYAPPSYIEDFSRRLSHAKATPSVYTPPPEEPAFVAPRRSQTQSPTQQQIGPRLSVPAIDPLKRPASVHAPGSPTKAVHPYAPIQGSGHTRSISQSLEFIPPNDGQELDPLERWKGAPIIRFGFGGTVLSCFPKHVPRYSAGQAVPKIKSMPGEVKIAQLNDWVAPPESIVPHPGPLKVKSKKKDLIAWLSSKIAVFENEGVPENLRAFPDSDKRHEEKILLWKIVRVLVEHDGGLQNSPEFQRSLREVIYPHLQSAESDPAYGNGFQSFSASQPFDAASRSDATDSKSLESIHGSLLVGDREKAVWSAADSRLWGHAMIIASTMDKAVWKQVVQEFVRREVRSATGKAESLAALYEIFAGNTEESIDELVPPSARAGLQMVSKVDGQGTARNTLAGLESWKDTLGLVLSNRSPEDHQALLALGRLLLSYGRVEAAHICLVFSRAAIFGGPDDPQANIVLLGVDHIHSSPMALLDDDAILLTEAYESAMSVLAASPTSTIPHLLAFKLIHASSLADRGRISEAQQYCDAISAALKAVTKPSGYLHQHLFFGVDELSARLRQSSGDAGASWISRPSMEKVSSSMWNKFTNFVAGDDSDAASTGSGKGADGDFGPFAKISGTPTVSRSPSVSDLYGPVPAAQPIAGSGPSRYQPNNQYAPSSSPDQGRGRSSLDSQRSASFGFSYGPRRGSHEYSASADNNMYSGGPFYGSPSAGYQSTPPQMSYMPLAPVEEDMAPQPYAEPASAPVQGLFANDSLYQSRLQNSFEQSPNEATAASQLGETGGYTPPVGNTGYEPPSADTNVPGLEASDESGDEKPRRKKSAMDDDDDEAELAARAAALKKAERERRDREADEAFRRAAETDAKKPAPAKSGWWFSGYFRRGNKEENNTSGKPIRAKLGEENSFYYDKELKKWVNKKDPNSATQARATPPPPKGPAPPSRSASGSSMPPPPTSGPSSRPPSSAGAPPPQVSGSPIPSSLGIPPPPLGPTPRPVSTGAVSTGPTDSPRPGSFTGPPPRPATSLSTASSIDDLLGAPQARKGNAGRARKKGRGYVDVMAK